MRLFIIIMSASLACAAISPIKRSARDQGYSNGPKCYDQKDTKCHKVPKYHSKQVCSEEFDVIEDTVYYEECEDIIETVCKDNYKEKASKKVHTSSTVLGHDSKLVGHGGENGYGIGFGKRSAEHYGYSDHYEPKCHDKKDRKCKKVPLTNKRKVPQPICKEIKDTIYIEECEDIITSKCDEYHEHVEHSSHVVGHDSKDNSDDYYRRF